MVVAQFVADVLADPVVGAAVVLRPLAAVGLAGFVGASLAVVAAEPLGHLVGRAVPEAALLAATVATAVLAVVGLIGPVAHGPAGRAIAGLATAPAAAIAIVVAVLAAIAFQTAVGAIEVLGPSGAGRASFVGVEVRVGAGRIGHPAPVLLVAGGIARAGLPRAAAAVGLVVALVAAPAAALAVRSALAVVAAGAGSAGAIARLVIAAALAVVVLAEAGVLAPALVVVLLPVAEAVLIAAPAPLGPVSAGRAGDAGAIVHIDVPLTQAVAVVVARIPITIGHGFLLGSYGADGRWRPPPGR